MAWKARIEFIHYQQPTYGAGRGMDDPVALFSSQTLGGAGAAHVRSAAAPVFGDFTLGHARVTVLAGAALVGWGNVPSASEAQGLRLVAGDRVTVAVNTGWTIDLVESADAEMGAPVSAGEAHLGQVGGESAVAVANFTRQANTTPYASGQIVAPAGSPTGSVTPLVLTCSRKPGGTGLVRRVRVASSNIAGVGASLRVHLFRQAPTVTVGDGGSFAGAVGGVAAIHLGWSDVTLDRPFSDGVRGVGAPDTGSEIVFDAVAGSTSLYALVEARGAYTPQSGETLTVALELLRD